MKATSPTKATSLYYFSVFVIFALVLFFYAVRFAELQSKVLNSPMHSLLVVASTFVVVTFPFLPPKTMGLFVRRMGIVILVFIQLKTDLDATPSHLVAQADLSGVTFISHSRSFVDL